ncbi:hypothetical protein MYP_2670 [Sporocytophaga myxococcoides]|uniref:Uncharacterized protein n=1 Tax=Sporocytophaga myxococcoides TaxID=153721 RepID=A0A098LES9_9BACT|nr:hypothetical protein MYP_2670 [Sporocytophaga myxococcoides]
MTDKDVLLIHRRTTSRKIKKEEMGEVIKNILGKDDFQLWSISMDKVVLFNKIGVLNKGRR